MDLHKDSQVPAALAAKYEAEAGHYWDLFYRRNETKFFKDRHWFEREFPQLLTAGVVLEVGCGVGNTAFPLLEINPSVMVYACDFAPSAVALVTAHPLYAASGRVTAFVADITADDLTAHVPPGSVDVVTMIFCLSAIAPGVAQRRALRRVAATLRPGGQLLLRDYAEGDLAQQRLRGEGRQQRLADNCFVRWDGTLSVYFAEEGIRSLFESEGFRCEHAAVSDRTVENRKKGQRMGRRFLQAVFTYTGQQQCDTGNAGSDGRGVSGGGGAAEQAEEAAQEQQQQQVWQQQAEQQQMEELQLQLGSAELHLSCRRCAGGVAAAAAAARAASQALAALLLACPAFFSGADVLELCTWDAPLASLAALRWCRRVVAAGAGEAAVQLHRRNARRNGHLFIIERLRLQQLAWAQPELEQQRQQQQEQLLRAFPAGFHSVLAAAPADTSDLQCLLSSAAPLLSRRPGSLLLLCALDQAAMLQAGEAAAAAAGLRAAPLPPELVAAAAAVAAGDVHILGFELN